MISVVSGCGRPLYCMFYLQNWCRNSLDVILFSLGYGAVLLCSSVGGSGRGCGMVDLRGCSGESCVVYPRSTQVKHMYDLWVKLRGDLLSWVASVMYPSVGVFLYYGLEDDVLFDCKSVVYLIPQFRFAKNIKIFYCVH